MPNFEVFDKRVAPTTAELYVTIQKRGTISLNQAAHAALGKPEAVELLFDAGEQIMGLRPADAVAAHGYTLRPSSKRGGIVSVYVFSGVAFVRYYDIDVSASRRWKAYMEDGVLCVKLLDPAIEVVGNRAKPVVSGDGQARKAPEEPRPEEA